MSQILKDNIKIVKVLLIIKEFLITIFEVVKIQFDVKSLIKLTKTIIIIIKPLWLMRDRSKKCLIEEEIKGDLRRGKMKEGLKKDEEKRNRKEKKRDCEPS